MERTIRYGGKVYNSIKEFAKEYNLPYQQTINKLNSGYTVDQIIRGEKKSDVEPHPLHIAVEYKGRQYSSLLRFCQENNLKYSRIYSLQKKGMSIEEILKHEGIVIADDVDFETEEFCLTNEDGLYEISKMSKGIRSVFEDNPYCVLGISCNSTKVEALDRRDKLEKIGRLGGSETFSSEYDLTGVEKPNRELGHLQIVLNNLDKLEYRWMWYFSCEYADKWNSEELYKNRSEKLEYDAFLACFQGGLIADPYFSDTERWRMILSMMNTFITMEDSELYRELLKRITDTERSKYNYRMVVNSFRDVVRGLLVSTMENADGEVLINIAALLSDSNGRIEKELRESLNTRALRWVDRILEGVKDTLKSVSAVKSLNQADSSEANKMFMHLDKLARRDFAVAEKISKKLDSFHGEMMMDRIKGAVYDATIVLTAGGRKKDACRFDSMIYIYCTEKQKEEIKKVYPAEWWEIPESELTIEECRRIAGRFEARNDWKNGFIWMLRAANKGDAASQNDVGVYFALGRGRQTDNAEAFKWFEKAAKGGNAVAYGNLAHRYYDGTYPCKKDREKAREYWITAYKINRAGGYDKKLDQYFPKWRSEKHPLLTFSERDWRYRVRPYAEDGIVDAEYWYAVLLYKGINGCTKSKDEARRWFLRAAVYDHPLAIKDLRTYYSINAGELFDANQMFNRGANFRKSDNRQDQDLAFYWFRKAEINGYDDADNIIGVCYNDGTGVEQNAEKACEYYLKAINRKNNAGALYNYGVHLYYGNGVAQDKEKAKEYLIKAKAQGNKAAIDFLKDKYGIEDKYRPFDFGDFEDLTIYNNRIRIDFCGIKTDYKSTVFQFWISNNDDNAHTFWIKNVKHNGESVGTITRIGDCKSGKFSFFKTAFEMSQEDNIDYIEFSVEVDDEGTTELFTLDTVKLTLFNRIHTYKNEVISGTGNGNLTALTNGLRDDDDEEDEEQKEYSFANDDFDDILIYEDDGIRIEFGGFEVEDEKVYAIVWSKNTSNKTYRLWAKDIVIDDSRVSKYEEVVTSMPDGSWESTKLLMDGVDLEVYYDVEFTIEVNDENDKALAFSKRVKCHIDFSEEEIETELVEHVDYDEDDDGEDETVVDDDDDDEEEEDDEIEDEEADADPFGLNDYLRVENSFCMVSEEHNGLEIYFPSIPPEFVRASLKEDGWRWHRQKGCWYARDTQNRRDLAKIITGKDLRE